MGCFVESLRVYEGCEVFLGICFEYVGFVGYSDLLQGCNVLCGEVVVVELFGVQIDLIVDVVGQ